MYNGAYVIGTLKGVRGRGLGDYTSLNTWRIMGLSKYGYKYPKWGYK